MSPGELETVKARRKPKPALDPMVTIDRVDEATGQRIIAIKHRVTREL